MRDTIKRREMKSNQTYLRLPAVSESDQIPDLSALKRCLFDRAAMIKILIIIRNVKTGRIYDWNGEWDNRFLADDAENLYWVLSNITTMILTGFYDGRWVDDTEGLVESKMVDVIDGKVLYRNLEVQACRAVFPINGSKISIPGGRLLNYQCGEILAGMPVPFEAKT